MTKNKLSDLQNLLFAQLERLDDEELTDEEVQKEVRRASLCISTEIKPMTGLKI